MHDLYELGNIRREILGVYGENIAGNVGMVRGYVQSQMAYILPV
jgi:hypothetical protein